LRKSLYVNDLTRYSDRDTEYHQQIADCDRQPTFMHPKVPAVMFGTAIALTLGLVAWYAFVGRNAPTKAPVPAAQGPAIARSSLVEAVELLPNTDTVVEAEKISDHVYWVRQKMAADPKEQNENDRSWSVDLATKKASLLGEYSFGYSYPEVQVSPDRSDERYFIVDWYSAYEGFSDRKDYIDRKTGKLEYTLESINGNQLSIEHEGKKFDIALSPVDGCGTYGHMREKAIVTGLNVSGKIIPLPKEQTVECEGNDMVGMAYYPQFMSFTYSPTIGLIQIGLPWKETLEVPADTLDFDKAAFKGQP